MKITIEKSSPCGVVAAPPSKSMAHRLLICGGLAKGKSEICGIARSQDVLATLDCLKALGAEYTYNEDRVVISGISKPQGADMPLYCRESGSTLRFFLPLCMFSEKEISLFGSETLLKRPLGVYKDICDTQGIEFKTEQNKATVCGKLYADEFTIPGDISSQFVTGLLFALPLLEKDSKIKILPPCESLSYINMTIDALKTFGVEVLWEDETTLFIKGNQQYVPCKAVVEGDYSNAAFFSALGSAVTVTDLKTDSLQGDRVYKELFLKLEENMPTMDISDCPDLGPLLFALAAAKKGGVFVGTKRLKIKESDRGAAMAEELKKFGVLAEIEENCIKIIPQEFKKPAEILNGHNDHRIVMALSVLLTLTGGSIDGAEAVSKSMPDFFEKLKELGVKVREET